MAGTIRKSYEELRELVEQHGGTMTFARGGQLWGAWTISYTGKEMTFASQGRSYPELNNLYVPKVPNPKYANNYFHVLVADAWE